eukprot:2752495-Amphidinium_carterae.1
MWYGGKFRCGVRVVGAHVLLVVVATGRCGARGESCVVLCMYSAVQSVVAIKLRVLTVLDRSVRTASKQTRTQPNDKRQLGKVRQKPRWTSYYFTFSAIVRSRQFGKKGKRGR